MARRPEPVRWTVEKAATEFAINRRTLTKRLRQESIEPGSDGMFGTSDITAAVFGDLAGEKTLLTKAERRLAEMKLAREHGLIIDAETARKTWESIIVPAKQKILSIPHKMESQMGLSEVQRQQLEAEIDDILGDLAKEPDYDQPEDAEEVNIPDS